MDKFTGNGNDETFTAGVVDAKTGADITSINDGDEIDGGAGDDTLNITATAANNTSLTGLTVKGVEVVNITGANNLGVSTTVTDAAVTVAEAQVNTIVAAAPTVVGQVQKIDFGDLSTTATGSGSIDVGIAGTTYAVAIAASKSASDIASLVAGRLDNSAAASSDAGLLGATGIADSVSVSGSVVTINFKPTTGTISAATLGNTSGSVPGYTTTGTNDEIGDVTAVVDSAATLSNAPVAAKNTLTLTASTIAASDVTIGNLSGTSAVKATIAATDTTTTAATKIAAAINGKAISAEVQTLSVVDALAASTGGGDLVLGGQTIALAAGATVTAQVSAITSAINGKLVKTADGGLSKVKAVGAVDATTGDGTVVFTFDASAGNVGAITLDATDTTITATGTVMSLAETERGSGVVTAKAAANVVTITYGLGFGAGAGTGTSTVADTAAGTSGLTLTGSESQIAGTVATANAITDVSATVNGVVHSLGSQSINAVVLAGIADEDAGSIAAGANVIADALEPKLGTVIGDGITTEKTASGTLEVTAVNAGQALPTIGVIQGEENTIKATATTTTANNSLTSVTPVAQVISFTDDVTSSSATAGDLYIDGVSYGAVNFLASSGVGGLANAINAILGDGVAVEAASTVVVTAPTAGVPLPVISLTGSTPTQVRANVTALTSTTTVADAAVSGSQFVGAEQVWLKGAASNETDLTVTGAQVAGLNGVTGVDGATYTLGTASTLALSGATTATDKTANVKGGGTTLNIIGTGTSGFGIDETNTTEKMDTLAVDTSGATSLNVEGMAALETISQSGAGALTIEGAGTDVATITGGASADYLTLNTATVVDTVSTAKDETVTGSLTGGAGNDVIVVTTSGAGVASVDAGAGDDTIKVAHTMTGEMHIAAGAGDDTVWLTKAIGTTTSAVSQLNANISVDGGDGIDTLALGGDTTYLTGDYTKLQKYATGFEKVTFYGATGASGTPLDASKLSDIGAYTVTTGANYLEEVANGTAFTNTVLIRDEDDYLGEINNYGAIGLTIVTADYEADTNFTDEEYDAVYGQDISITHASLSQSSALAAGSLNYGATYTVSASDVTLVALSVGGATAAASSKADVTLAGQMETATVILSSARGATKTAAGNGADEYMATFAIEVDPASSTSTDTNAMQGLTSITVSGAGIVTIDAGYDAEATNDEAAANLTVIDLSGMTDFADLTYKGEAVSDTYTNLSTSTVTLNSEVAETLKLGGALDIVNTDSSVDTMDIIEGFSLIATADEDDDDDIVDYAQSDVLNLGGSTDYSTADNDADGSAGSSTDFVADDTEYASLDAALLSLAATASNEVVFHAEGNTYVFISDSDTELDADDTVIQLTGIYDLDLLVNAII